ncbi:MAG: glycosyltransferase [Candidatus Melainabacteria bacterium]|nr:glycosyltransferase [Candidatus Melainabacteria bacterium]
MKIDGGAAINRRPSGFDLSQYNELRATIVSERAKRVINSRSWRVTEVARKVNALSKKLKRAAMRLGYPLEIQQGRSYDQVLAEAVELVEASGLFDEPYYLEQLKQRGIKTGDCITHFLTTGWKTGLNPNTFFDCRYYINKASKANIQVRINPLVHYLLEGARLRLRTSSYFDTAYYVSNQQDVIASDINPLTHFLQFGIFENRLPVMLSSSTSLSEGKRRTYRNWSSANSNESVETSRVSGESQFDCVLCIHSASLTGAPLLGLSILRHFLDLGLEVLLVLLDDGELVPEFFSLCPVIDLSECVNYKEYLSAELENLLSSGRLTNSVPVLLNSAENLVICEVFNSLSFNTTVLVHEFMTDYSEAQQRHLLENADNLVFSCQTTKASCHYLHQYQCRTHILPQGLLDETFLNLDRQMGRAFLQKQLSIEPEDFVVLACGTAEHRKGVDYFVQSAVSYLSRQPEGGNTHFIWIGDPLEPSDMFYRLVQQDLSRSASKANIHFVGKQSELAPFFAGADLFMLPSRQDPLPCVLHLAMAAGLPTLAFADCGGASEILAGGGGSLVPYGNIDRMVDAIQNYRQDHNLLQRAKHEARKIVGSRFLMKDYIAALLALTGLVPSPVHSVDQVKEHYEAHSQTYLDTYGSILQAYRPQDVDEMLQAQLDLADLKDGMSVLDAGCGVCGPAVYFAARRDLHIEAITLSEAQKEAADHLIAREGLSDKVFVQVADFHSLEDLYPEDRFDRILFLESLCHSPAPYEALSSARRVIKEDGLLFIKDFVMHDWREDPEMHEKQQCYAGLSYELYRYRLLYIEQLTALLKLSGFSVKKSIINLYSGQEDPSAQLNFEGAAGFDWRKIAGGSFHIADSIILLAEPF